MIVAWKYFEMFKRFYLSMDPEYLLILIQGTCEHISNNFSKPFFLLYKGIISCVCWLFSLVGLNKINIIIWFDYRCSQIEVCSFPMTNTHILTIRRASNSLNILDVRLNTECIFLYIFLKCSEFVSLPCNSTWVVTSSDMARLITEWRDNPNSVFYRSYHSKTYLLSITLLHRLSFLV